MKMNEFGIENKKKILLIHGAGTTYKMWTAQIKELEKVYHIYAPTLSGHEMDDDSEYVSPKIEAEKIVEWFKLHNIHNIYLICGASLGANVGTEIILKYPNFSEYALIESLKSYHYGAILNFLFMKFGKGILKKAASVDGTMKGSYNKEYVSDDMKNVLLNISDKSLNNILRTASRYTINNIGKEVNTKVLVVYGSKERKLCKRNTEAFCSYLKNSNIKEIPGYNHGELSIGNPKKHLEIMKEALSIL